MYSAKVGKLVDKKQLSFVVASVPAHKVQNNNQATEETISGFLPVLLHCSVMIIPLLLCILSFFFSFFFILPEHSLVNHHL